MASYTIRGHNFDRTNSRDVFLGEVTLDHAIFTAEKMVQVIEQCEAPHWDIELLCFTPSGTELVWRAFK